MMVVIDACARGLRVRVRVRQASQRGMRILRSRGGRKGFAWRALDADMDAI
jgi:hypothetical protein